jgi:hypothetical protein
MPKKKGTKTAAKKSRRQEKKQKHYRNEENAQSRKDSSDGPYFNHQRNPDKT